MLKTMDIKVNYQKLRDGTNITFLTGSDSLNSKQNLKYYATNPILNDCINIGADYFSKFEFALKDKEGNYLNDTALIEKLNSSFNNKQSKEDFLKQYYIFLMCFPIVPITTIGSNLVKKPEKISIYNLRYDKLDFTDFNNQKFLTKEYGRHKDNVLTISYDDNGYNKEFNYYDLIRMFDSSINIDSNNPFISTSRVSALHKNINNYNNCKRAEEKGVLTAGNISIQGKAVAGSGAKYNMPNASNSNNKSKYNLIRSVMNVFKSSNNVIAPDIPVEAQDLTADLNKISLDKLISENTGTIVKGLGLSNELYEYKITGGLGSNKSDLGDAIIHFHENHLIPRAKDLANSFDKYFKDKRHIDDNVKLCLLCKDSYVEEKRKKVKMESIKMRSEVLSNLIKTGLTLEEANKYIEDEINK